MDAEFLIGLFDFLLCLIPSGFYFSRKSSHLLKLLQHLTSLSFKLILFVSLLERLQNCLIDFAHNKMLLKTSVAAARMGTPFQP